jgi:mono/diheme cytochrome c family protein
VNGQHRGRSGQYHGRYVRRRSWRALALGLLLGALGEALVLLLVGAPLAVAHRSNAPLERWYSDVAVRIAARFGAGDRTNPAANDPKALTVGRSAYTGSCSACHGAAGDGRGAFGPATYPPATDLTSPRTRAKTDAELFWIIKNGLSFTGMPAFGGQYRDQDVWALVTYLRALQNSRGEEAVSLVVPLVPTPTTEQLASADPAGDAVQRGAAAYFAQGCASCHGPAGNAPGDLAFRSGAWRDVRDAVREGRRGMPAYSRERLPDAQLTDLQAYVRSLTGQLPLPRT